MLMQNFKGAVELGIADFEFRSLVTVLGMLERGELMHAEFALCKMSRKPNEFNMAATFDNHCGTIGCIAGWAHSVSGGKAFLEIVNGGLDWQLRNNQPLLKMFGIGTSCGVLYSITPDQAATALRSYLTTSDAHWDLAVA